MRVAVVGTGHLGREHARIYASLPQVQLAGIFDKDAAKAADAAAHAGDCRIFDSFAELLDKCDCFDFPET